MEQNDWSRFILRININAEIQDLYDSWATRGGMESWFLRLCEYKTYEGRIRKQEEQVETGDTYKWLWHGWPDDTVENGKILSCDGTSFISFSFGKAGTCSINIKKEQGKVIMELIQKDIPSDEAGKYNWHVGCKTGWTFYLTNLKSLKEGGIDLRNKNVELQQVLNA